MKNGITPILRKQAEELALAHIAIEGKQVHTVYHCRVQQKILRSLLTAATGLRSSTWEGYRKRGFMKYEGISAIHKTLGALVVLPEGEITQDIVTNKGKQFSKALCN